MNTKHSEHRTELTLNTASEHSEHWTRWTLNTVNTEHSEHWTQWTLKTEYSEQWTLYTDYVWDGTNFRQNLISRVIDGFLGSAWINNHFLLLLLLLPWNLLLLVNHRMRLKLNLTNPIIQEGCGFERKVGSEREREGERKRKREREYGKTGR